jgi:hypothetical protein
MKKVVRALLQVLLALALLYMFFIWAPWLTAQPVSSISDVQLAHEPVPPGARSFTVSHGKVNFRALGTPTEEPVAFGLLTLGIVIDGVCLFLLFPKGYRGRRPPRTPLS